MRFEFQRLAVSSTLASSVPSASSSATASPSSTAPTSAAAGGAGTLTASGAVSGTLTESANAADSSCASDTTGITKGMIQFSGAAGRYTLQLSLPAGSTTFPSSKGNALVAFFNNNDSTKEWSAGTTAQPGHGTVSLNAKKGTINATLAYNPPQSGGPALGPVTVSGDFACP